MTGLVEPSAEFVMPLVIRLVHHVLRFGAVPIALSWVLWAKNCSLAPLHAAAVVFAVSTLQLPPLAPAV